MIHTTHTIECDTCHGRIGFELETEAGTVTEARLLGWFVSGSYLEAECPSCIASNAVPTCDYCDRPVHVSTDGDYRHDADPQLAGCELFSCGGTLSTFATVNGHRAPGVLA